MVTEACVSKLDLERVIHADPALTTAERYIAEQYLKTLDGQFRPVDSRLHSQSLLGWRTATRRETVNRALRKLCVLGYFTRTWVTVQRKTKQGIKGVTRAMVTLGPALRRLVDQEDSGGGHVSAGKPRGVTVSHPSPTPPGSPGTVGSSASAKSADRNGLTPVDNADFKRKTLESWPRLAGYRGVIAAHLPSARPVTDFYDPETLRGMLAELGDDDDDAATDYAATVAAKRAAAAAAERRRIAEQDERIERRQPRRLPRSKR